MATTKVAVITGAGRGIGREHALELARQGVAVVVNDLGGSLDGKGVDTSPAEQVVEEIRALGGHSAHREYGACLNRLHLCRRPKRRLFGRVRPATS